ncbi:hypothetical protein BUE76_22690 [Cnuella takakiae]|nr:hypothetical protein BUE76_22690 [Cnuella takakiae]
MLHIILLLFALPLSPYCQDYSFRHYEVEAGLSNNAVICSAQDKLGFMWFGTRDGLNRFDGHSFKVYRFSNKEQESNGNNFVHALHIDAAGTLLVGTEKELYRYDAKADSFRFLTASRMPAVDEIITDRRGHIWFIAGNTLYRFAEKTGSLKLYEPQQFSWITSIGMANDGTIWVATSDGLLKKYDAVTDGFSSYDLFAHSPNRDKRWIEKIHVTGDGRIMVGTSKGGFKIFDMKTGSYRDIPLCCEKLDNLFIRTFLQATPDEWWIGTETGLFTYNQTTGVSKKLVKKSSDQFALSDNVIYTFCKDREGGIWVGTYFGGLNYYPIQHTPFQKFYHKPSENSLSGNVVREICKDHLGNLWVGTEDAGLNKLDAATGRFIQYKPDSSSGSIAYICIHNLMPDGDKLWIGTYEHGLDILNIRTGKVVRHYESGPASGLKSNFPFCLLKTREGKILVGTNIGIYSYNTRRDHFDPLHGFPANDWYLCMLEDREGTLWTGISGKGVYYRNSKTGASGSFSYSPADEKSIASNKVNAIFEDSRRQLWFATENGLCKWNPVRRNFDRYDIANGFPSNFMLSILEDEKGQLWISTTRGLTSFDPATKKVLVYTTANGLLSDQFNFSSAYRDENNRMYFGSAKGLVGFQPAVFKQSNYQPPVYITGFQIKNGEVPIGKAGSPLSRSIILTDKITLAHDQATFSIEFAALGFTAPQMVAYAYQMEGLSAGWTNLKNNRKVYFTELHPGTYTFRVKAANSSGIWNGREATLSITILPPWWASRWANTLYLVLVLLLLYGIVHLYHRRIAARNRKQVAQLKAAKEKEVLEAKIEFFTNVAHEVRTPLTLIKIPLAKALKKAEQNPEMEKSLKIIDRNTNRLIDLTNQLLDFRQVEISNYQLSFAPASISDLLNDAYQNFSSMAEQKGISFLLHLPAQPVWAHVDTDAFNKIIYNLLGNAVKYADGLATITLEHNQWKQAFVVQVKNDGPLIAPEYRQKIFEPFFRIPETRGQKGTGIGLALANSLTQLHNGSLVLDDIDGALNTFTLTIPMQQQQQDAAAKDALSRQL